MSAHSSRDPSRGKSSKAFGGSSSSSSGGGLEVLPAIDETRPRDEDVADVEGEKEYGKRCSAAAGPASPGHKKGMKDKVRGLKDKYVSCLHAIDGAGDMRACAGGGGAPCLAVPPALQPFDSATSAATLSTAALAN